MVIGVDMGIGIIIAVYFVIGIIFGIKAERSWVQAGKPSGLFLQQPGEAFIFGLLFWGIAILMFASEGIEEFKEESVGK